MRPLTGLSTAISFLTVLPGGRGGWAPERSVAWYPAMGVALAILLGTLAWGLAELFAPLLAAALLVAGWAAVTGALHLDGLADTADAAFAPVERDRRLAILSDVHHGTFAAVAIVLALVIKVAALASLATDRAEFAAACALAVCAARALLPLAIRVFSAARPGGLGASVRAGATPLVIAIGATVALAAGALCYGLAGAAVAAGLAAGALAAGWWLSGRFDGLTGDTYGAIVELVELAALVALGSLVTNGHAHAFPLGGLR